LEGVLPDSLYPEIQITPKIFLFVSLNNISLVQNRTKKVKDKVRGACLFFATPQTEGLRLPSPLFLWSSSPCHTITESKSNASRLFALNHLCLNRPVCSPYVGGDGHTWPQVVSLAILAGDIPQESALEKRQK
jgi:hypothetical protein